MSVEDVPEAYERFEKRPETNVLRLPWHNVAGSAE